MRSELFGRKSQPILEVQSKGDVLIGKVEVNSNVWVDYNGRAKRLVEILNLNPDANGRYYLTLRGTKTKTGDEIWPGKDAIEKLNLFPGIQSSTRNYLQFERLSNSYSKMYSSLIAAKMEANFLSAIGEVEKLVKATNPSLRMEARVGNLMNLVNPFMPIDPSLLRGSKGFGSVNDYSKFKIYADVQNQGGQTQSYVGNTFTSFSRIQDTDTDTLQILQIVLKDAHNNIKGTYMYDKKFPHTTHQMGSVLPTNQLDFEGEKFDPLKIYRRASGIFGSSRDPGLVNAHGTQGLAKGLRQTAQIATDMSVEKTYRNADRLKELIKKSLKENMTGIYTASQWQYESLQAEHILNKLPEYLAEEYNMSKSVIDQLMAKLEEPGMRAKFKFTINQGFKGVRLKGTESIQKSREESIAKLTNEKEFEALAMEVALDYQDKIMSKGNPAAYGELQQLAAAEAFLVMSPEERLRAMYGLSSPKFKVVNGFNVNRKPKAVEFIPASKLVLENDQGRKSYLLDSLLNARLYDRKTGTFTPLMQLQEISNAKLFDKSYLDKLSPDQRDLATKSYALVMNGLDENGNVVRLPIAGTHPSIKEPNRKELSFVLTAQQDPITGKFVNPHDLLRDKVEMAAQKLSPFSHLRNFGIGELTGAYSLNNLKRPGSMRYVSKLASANKVSEARVLSLIYDGGPKAVEMLKSYKTQLDIVSMGDVGTTVLMDATRIVKEVFGGVGVDAEFKRSANGSMYYANSNAQRHIAEMITIYTGMENLDTSKKADLLTKAAMKGGLIGAFRESKEDETIVFGTRGTVKNGRVVSPLSSGDTFYEAKRIAKRAKIGQKDLHLGQTKLALISFDVKKDAMKNLGYNYENGAFTPISGANTAFGDKAAFQAEHFDEGVFLGTNALEKKIEQTILGDLEAGIDYQVKPQGEFQHKYSYVNPITGKTEVRYTKAPIETQRLLSNRTGSLRTIPHFGTLQKATTMVNGVEQELHGLLTLGEALSKSGMPDILAQKSKELGIYNLFSEAVKEVQETNTEGEKANQFLKIFQQKAGSDVKLTYGSDAETNMVKNAILFNMDVTVRNLDADKQVHRLSNFGTYVDRIKAFMSVTEEGTKSIRQQLEYNLTGQSSMDSVFEIGKSMHTFLTEQGVISADEVQDTDITNLLYMGYNRMSNNPIRGRGSSLLDQLSFTDREVQIEKVAQALRLGADSAKNINDDYRIHRNQEALSKSLDHGKQYKIAQAAFQQGLQSAIGEAGIDNADTILRAFFGALG